ncbi:hypothetical protein [Maribacter sp. 2210JD10-5]|uniref:hypothetical protein n=1 Tax=Maribacter sp. 2210JD10-5 TaxID=3386272 RepID=UPI0039BCE49E
MPRNILIIVESPLQLINANEYLKAYEMESLTDFFLVSSREKSNIDQMNKAFESLNLKGDISRITVCDIDKSLITRFKFYWKVIKAARKKSSKRYDLLLVGHIASIYQAILANSRKNMKTIYLDDGTAAFYEHALLKEKKLKSFSPIHKRIFPILLGLKANIISYQGKIHFFTMYKDLVEEDHDFLSYTLNEFLYLKEEYKKKRIDTDSIYFIGTPFYWNSDSLNNAESIFAQVGEFLKDKNVTYFPHRYESDEHFKLVEKLGWNVVEAKVPIELSLINISCLPNEFGMFTSSAFYTINKLIPYVKFKSFELNNLEDIFNGTNTYKLYRDYDENLNIEVIKLN